MEEEGFDRTSLDLPGKQLDLLKDIVKYGMKRMYYCENKCVVK